MQYKQRSKQQVGWAGWRNLVCAELGKRGFIVTSFTGNVPEFDLIVADGSLKTLPVQVKTSRGLSWPTKETVFYTQEEGSSRDRSEERRVGKECRYWWWSYHEK